MLEFAVKVGKLNVVDRRAVAAEVERRIKRQWCLAYIAPWAWVVG